MSYHCYRRPLIEPVPAPILPTGFTIRPVAGEAEAAMRAALQRDAFSPQGSTTYEEGTLRQLAVMKMRSYDPHFDLLFMAPAGTPATGCLSRLSPAIHL